jgi:hypothetical protein
MQFLFHLAKHIHAKFQLSSLYPDGLRQIFDLFSRKIQDFSGNLLSKFQKIPNLSIQFYNKPSKAYSCKFQLTSLYPDGLRQFFYLFSRKIQDFSGNHFSEFQRIPNLSILTYFTYLALHTVFGLGLITKVTPFLSILR